MTIKAPTLKLQPVSVTRQMASALSRLQAEAAAKGMKLHHLGAGYPHPEVSDPTAYVAQRDACFRQLARKADPERVDDALTGLLRPPHGPPSPSGVSERHMNLL